MLPVRAGSRANHEYCITLAATMKCSYDGLLVVSFGGPEGMDDVMPFLDHVLRGTNVPLERKRKVAHHYNAFGGVSPINGQNRALIAALEAELADHHVPLAVYWGNRNWHPFLKDAIRQMAKDGIRRSLAFVTAAYSGYSTCRQYLDDIHRARRAVGSQAPQIDKLRVFYNHPGFIEPMVERVQEAMQEIPATQRAATQIIYTAHSIPLGMARACHYEAQLEEACRLVSLGVGANPWLLAYQSRSGPATQAWLEPDICDALERLRREQAIRYVVVVPIGFISDHMEVVYDLDTEARHLCDRIGLRMVRAKTAGTHPRFVTMIRQLIVERMDQASPRLALGVLNAGEDVCPPDCCPARFDATAAKRTGVSDS